MAIMWARNANRPPVLSAPLIRHSHSHICSGRCAFMEGWLERAWQGYHQKLLYQEACLLRWSYSPIFFYTILQLIGGWCLGCQKTENTVLASPSPLVWSRMESNMIWWAAPGCWAQPCTGHSGDRGFLSLLLREVVLSLCEWHCSLYQKMPSSEWQV